MDNTLAHIIVPMLIQLKASKPGFPSSIIDDDIESDENGLTNAGYRKACEVWSLTLDKMIWSFKQVITDDLESFMIVEGELEIVKSSGVSTTTRWKTEPVVNENAYQAYLEHVQEGLDLFGKHYRSLWE